MCLGPAPSCVLELDLAVRSAIADLHEIGLADGSRAQVRKGAAVIIGETAGAQRFRSKDAYARFTGTAPIPVWSGSNSGKVRLNRGGNRTINCALHMIAITQIRGIGPGKDYVDKLLARGKTRKEAIRLLRRRLSDVVFRALLADEHRDSQQPAATESEPLPQAA